MAFIRLFAPALAVLIATILLVSVSLATVIAEKKWDPFAGSFQTMLFMADLKPVPWEKIRIAFEEPLSAAEIPVSGKERLEGLVPGNGEALSAAISAAIASEDRQALYEAASRALAASLTASLDRAAEALSDPASAQLELLNAQQLYRAVDPFVRQSDPDNARAIGRAWLTLTTTTGSSGVFGIGSQEADTERYLDAGRTILTYMHENYSPVRFTERVSLAPAPEGALPKLAENPIRPWFPPGTDIADQDPLPLLVLNFEEKGIDEADLPLVAYGDMLFDSPEIFGEPARTLGITCSTCHNRSDINNRFFIPGVSHRPGGADVDGGFFNAIFNDFQDDALDTPSLRGIRLTAPYGRDGRIASLREFTRNVIVSEFGGNEPTPFMLDALIAYMNEFDFLPNSKIDRFGELTDRSDASVVRGETLFNTPFDGMAGKSCASCHVPATNFTDNRRYDIGSVKGNYDGSRGGQFDTPTLINVKYTAPYFHDGSLPTLGSVVDWFNDTYALDLNESQRADLTAYVETIGGADEPYEVFDGKATPFALAFAELTTFATTLEALIPARDKFHANLMLDTVITDLRQDISAMANRDRIDQVIELADGLSAVQSAINKDGWVTASSEWLAFKTKKTAYEEAMY
ncbi:cytochrome c peroxidase [Hoeflea sp. TYP-13]|uniref:cytochrome c peroxidase n=1 Tax=Hoeflea sp. TYP-13 TaxID=3230023 RepID=UPI0034C5BD47